MSSPLRISLMRRTCLVSSLALLVAVTAGAQSSPSASRTTQYSAGESSSASFAPGFDSSLDEGLPSAGQLRAAAAALGSSSGSGSSAAQDENGGGGGRPTFWQSLALEFGGGTNGPLGSSSNEITWGGNFTVGAGYRFNNRFSALLEYQFIDDKLPGAVIAETGSTGGDAHIWSFGIEPVVDLFPKSTNSVYVTGGGGFYRKVTNFTDPEETEFCEFFECFPEEQNEVVGHFSSNQGGFNIGGGYTHRIGGLYHDGNMKLFADVRYLDIMTPATGAAGIMPNGLPAVTVGAGTHLIPITFGLRW